MKTGSLVAVALFTVVAILHLLRMLSGTEIVVGGNQVPQWVSLLGVVIPGVVAWMLWRESK
jgi:hypothetical protein